MHMGAPRHTAQGTHRARQRQARERQLRGWGMGAGVGAGARSGSGSGSQVAARAASKRRRGGGAVVGTPKGERCVSEGAHITECIESKRQNGTGALACGAGSTTAQTAATPTTTAVAHAVAPA
jgi:hypothetical protein